MFIVSFAGHGEPLHGELKGLSKSVCYGNFFLFNIHWLKFPVDISGLKPIHDIAPKPRIIHVFDPDKDLQLGNPVIVFLALVIKKDNRDSHGYTRHRAMNLRCDDKGGVLRIHIQEMFGKRHSLVFIKIWDSDTGLFDPIQFLIMCRGTTFTAALDKLTRYIIPFTGGVTRLAIVI